MAELLRRCAWRWWIVRGGRAVVRAVLWWGNLVWWWVPTISTTAILLLRWWPLLVKMSPSICADRREDEHCTLPGIPLDVHTVVVGMAVAAAVVRSCHNLEA
jgi:hypothetical protein